MEPTVLIALIAGAGSLFSAAVAYGAGKRATSGSVRTSDAGMLWKAMSDWTEDLTNDVANLKITLSQKDERIAHLEQDNRRLQDRVNDLQNQVFRLNGKVDRSVASQEEINVDNTNRLDQLGDQT